MAHCKYCEHSIFNEQWGEWKCKKFELTVYNPEKRASRCKHMKEKPEQTKK